ncbi:hypothetical protein ACWEGS_28355 [Streptomyces sp. NPDC004822]
MRLQLVPPDEIDEPRLWWRPQEPRLRPTTDSRLCALRQHVLGDALAAVKPGRAVRVATYVYAAPGVDAEATHTLLGRYARDRGWAVHREHFTDEPTGGPIAVRPQFNTACRRAGSGFVDGVLAPDRGAMPSADEAYEAYLHWLHRHYAFVAFLLPSYGGHRA